MPITLKELPRVNVTDVVTRLRETEENFREEAIEELISWQETHLSTLQTIDVETYKQQYCPDITDDALVKSALNTEKAELQAGIENLRRQGKWFGSRQERYDQISLQGPKEEQLPALVISARATRAQLSLYIGTIAKQLDQKKSNRMILTIIQETLEFCKDKDTLQIEKHQGIDGDANKQTTEDIVIPLLFSEKRLCESLCKIWNQLDSFQREYEETDACGKYAVFLRALEENTEGQLDPFINRVIEDKKFIDQPDFLKKIQSIYPLLSKGIKKGKFTADEIDALKGVKDSLDGLIKLDKMPLKGSLLQQHLNEQARLLVTKFASKTSHYSFIFKQLINEMCKRISISPPFMTTEITDQVIHSFQESKQGSDEQNDEDQTANPMQH